MFAKRLLGIFVVSMVFLSFPTCVFASIYINEVSPSTDIEWIELYNSSDNIQNLSGYMLKDANSNPDDDLILSGTIIAKGYLVFTHNKGWLNDSGDTVKLYDNASPSGILDEYIYGSIDSSHNFARSPDGNDNWIKTDIVTNGFSNPTSFPIPTSVNNPTNSPTSSPTSTPTPAPTKSPTPRPTAKPTTKPSPSSTPEVLGVETSEPTSSPIPTEMPSESKNKFPYLAFGMIGFGVCSIGAAFFPFLKAKFKEYNGKSDENT